MSGAVSLFRSLSPVNKAILGKGPEDVREEAERLRQRQEQAEQQRQALAERQRVLGLPENVRARAQATAKTLWETGKRSASQFLAGV